MDSPTNPPAGEFCRAVLENLCERSRIAVVVADASGSAVWVNPTAEKTFPGCFHLGRSVSVALDRCTVRDLGGPEDALAGGPGEGEFRRAVGDAEAMYRYVQEPLPGTPYALHVLSNISGEKRLKQHVIHNLQQLKIMREIVDALYESFGTQEVIYLTLVAVTSQMGFGFNRAFFLNVKGNRLRGRIGIGPSNHEEAHQIWTRIASLNFSSLREVYNDLTRNGDVPDARTQEIALRLDFELPQTGAGDPGPDRSTNLAELPAAPGLLGVLQRGRPARLRATDATAPIDRTLFQLLSTDVLAIVPLLVRGRLAGVIIADNFITRKPISDTDLSVLKTFAGYAGVALERTHLYEELRENVEKLKEANASLKANHEKLLQAEKLSAIGELAAYVSHEIRNPLVAIGGLARSLLKDDISNPDTIETLQIIVSEVSRLEKFLRDTLDFVKPRRPRRASIEINQLVNDSTATFRQELAKHAVSVELDLHPDPIRGLLDRDMLVHALSNLIKNAIEAMPGGGRLFLGTSIEGRMATVLVGDSGPGIPAEVVPRIFDPFFTTKKEGTGLGLSFASQHIRSLGGQLTLEPSESFGTLFKLVLPLEEADAHCEFQEDAGLVEAQGRPVGG